MVSSIQPEGRTHLDERDVWWYDIIEYYSNINWCKVDVIDILMKNSYYKHNKGSKMKDTLKNLGLSLLGMTVKPVAKFVAGQLVAFVKKTETKDDEAFLKELAEQISSKL